jgi:hypothetical protein
MSKIVLAGRADASFEPLPAMMPSVCHPAKSASRACKLAGTKSG